MREFRRARKAAEGTVEGFLERRARLRHRRAVEHGAGIGPRHDGGERGLKLLILRGDLPALFAVVLGHAPQQIAKCRHPIARLLGKIGAAEKRLLPRCEEHRQRPTAGAVRQHLLRDLINLVEIGTFFAIDLDVDEQLIHQCGSPQVFEGLMGHDMTPVTGGIADGQKDGLVFLLRLAQRRFAPGIPLDRIVRVLQQVGAGLLGEMIAQHLHGPSRLE